MAGKIPSLTEQNFDSEVLKSDVQVLVDFGATWCGPCKALAPIVEKISEDFKGKVKVVAVDIDECPEVAKKYSVRSVPTVLVFKGGQKSGQSAGLTSRENLLKLLDL